MDLSTSMGTEDPTPQPSLGVRPHGPALKRRRVLALDGGLGGLQGFTSLVMLNELMKRVEVLGGHRTATVDTRPCDNFDLIIGTGIGGLLALFLGRMRMTVRESIEEYVRIAASSFESPQRLSAARRPTMPPTLLDNRTFNRIFGDITERFLGDKNARLRVYNPAGCHTVIFTYTGWPLRALPRTFRSYTTSGDVSVLNVAQAIVSFRPVVYQLEGKLEAASNPAVAGLVEARELWQESSIGCLVSLGASLHYTPLHGLPTSYDGDARRKVAERYYTNVCDHVHYRVSRLCSYFDIPYFRFNVEYNGKPMDMEWANLEALTAITDSYLRWFTVNTRLTSCASLLWVEEPFSTSSPLCLDGRISKQSKYVVASGGYADVWTGSLGGHTVAVKIMRPFSSMGSPIETSKLIQRLWREYLTWSELSHPNVLECLGFSYDFTPESNHQVPSLISPWMSNGTVLSYIQAHPNVDRIEIVVGIARGLAYLHDLERKIVHGDVRAGNILVSDNGTPCLADFGLSRVISETHGMTTSSEVAGALRWMAPELFHGGSLSLDSDVWAYGMTILEIFTGKRPFNDLALEPVVLHQILGGQLPARPTLASAPSLTDEVWTICQKCWHTQPDERLCMADILDDIPSLSRGDGRDEAPTERIGIPGFPNKGLILGPENQVLPRGGRDGPTTRLKALVIPYRGPILKPQDQGL